MENEEQTIADDGLPKHKGGFQKGRAKTGGRTKNEKVSQKMWQAREIADAMEFNPMIEAIKIYRTGKLPSAPGVKSQPVSATSRVRCLEQALAFLLPRLSHQQVSGVDGGPIETVQLNIDAILADPALVSMAQALSLNLSGYPTAAPKQIAGPEERRRMTSWDRSILRTQAPCGCVLRAIFRACYAKFKQKAAGRFRRPCNFVCDFVLVSRRALANTPLDLAVFNAHFLLAGDWRLCCRQLKIDRGSFFHAVYRIQQKLGLAYAACAPYPLYPLGEYFCCRRLPVGVKPCPVPAMRMGCPLRPPWGPPRQPVARPSPAREQVAPVPVLPSVVDVPAHVRVRYRSGASLRAISAEMVRLNVPAPRGAEWGIAAVRRILLDKAA